MARLDLVWVRGAGELASATAHLLFRLGYPVILSEIDPPLAIRRPVSFSDALLEGQARVENILAKFYPTVLKPQFPLDHIPVFEDNESQLRSLKPGVLVDGRMLKKDLPDMRAWADLVIGLGPGFDTNKNCHAVIETKRGHDLGRVIASGAPIPDTGIPGQIGGESSKRLVRSPGDGTVKWSVAFGDLVEAGQVLGQLSSGKLLTAPTSGMVRGLISEKTLVRSGMKIGDIDPRGASVNYLQISDKARSIARGVLEAMLIQEQRKSP
jgi:xanthine dehydrogenase accessory factor